MKNFSDYFLLSTILIAFAANSVLNRLALKTTSLAETVAIDPASFTMIRLMSGAIVLVLLLYFSGKKLSKPKALHWRGSVFLFIYAITFSYAYISLDAAIGALILFGIVQICIIAIAIFRGKRLSFYEWLGCLLAVVGLLVLTLPHVIAVAKESSQQLSVIAILLMVVAGVAWGLFTVNGAGSKDSMFDTATCFVLSLPLIFLVSIIVLVKQDITYSAYGIMLAMLSGVFASGLGYAMWYQILPRLAPSQAASAQLLVPIIAAGGGLLFLNEQLTLNFIVAAVLTLGGVLIVIRASNKA